MMAEKKDENTCSGLATKMDGSYIYRKDLLVNRRNI